MRPHRSSGKGTESQNMTREIHLTQGKIALVDDDDYEPLSRFKWSACKNRNTYYARREGATTDGRRTTFYMHREILGKVHLIDHRDGNGLNNTRENLRAATVGKNGQNRRQQRNNTSGFKGVCRCGSKWRAQITADGKWYHLGLFESPELAACAYNTAAQELHGEFASE